MTQEDKELLLKDLCARLPYGVYVLAHDTFEYSTVPYENVYLKSSNISSLIDSISLNERYNNKDKQFNRIIKEHKDSLEFKHLLQDIWDKLKDWKCANLIDWLNVHHFDYRGLIEKNLALEAPEGMYNIK